MKSAFPSPVEWYALGVVSGLFIVAIGLEFMKWWNKQ